MLDDKVLRTLHVEVRVSIQQALVGTLEESLISLRAGKGKEEDESETHH